MSFTERISIVVDLLTDKATANAGNLRTALRDADTAAGKFKVGVGAAGTFLKSHMQTAALGAAAAITGWVTKSTSDWQRLALEASKLADSTGASVEEMSRWIEVAGDVGVSSDTVAAAMQKMSKAAGMNPEKFDALGVSMVYARDGALDVNATFLNVLERIGGVTDQAERQRIGTQLLGRQWAELAEIINGDVRGALDSVSDAKIVDPEAAADARELRDAMDELKGKFEDFANTVGRRAVPLISDLVDIGIAIADAFDELNDSLEPTTRNLELANGKIVELKPSILDQIILQGDLAGALERVAGNLAFWSDETKNAASVSDGNAAAANRYVESLVQMHEAIPPTTTATVSLADAADRLRSVTEQLDTKFKELTGTIDDEAALLDLEDTFDEVKRKGLEAFNAVETGAADAEEQLRDHRQAVLDLEKQVIAYATQVGTIPDEMVTKIVTLIDNGQVEEAERILAILARNRTASIDVVMGDIRVGPNGALPRRATGGPGQGRTIVGEDGPEVVDLPTGSYVNPASSTPRLVGSGGPSIVNNTTIYMPAGASPAEVRRASRRYEKRNGR